MMDCPKCHQPTSYDETGHRCALCGFDLVPLRMSLVVVYSTTFALFLSTLIYAGLVFGFELQGWSAKPAAALSPVLVYGLLVVSVLIFGIGASIGRRFASASTMRQVQRLFLIQMALAEAIAIYGLLLYILGHSLQWFVTFLGLSWLAFLHFGSRLPVVVRRLGELAASEADKKR
jgi:F0F1-type ATP synthase membrane subunit c/vacuolar-type H+-ATPase subunit K